MRLRLSRRRALVRGLALLGGLTIGLGGAQGISQAQSYDPPSDVPWPDTPSVSTPVAADPTSAPAATPAADSTATDSVATPVAAGATTEPVPLGQASSDREPAFAPAPEADFPTTPGTWGVAPVKLMIPALGIEAAIEAVGTDSDGAMTAPTNPDEVAWYKLGPGMGVPGNAVFAGHVNWAGSLRVFGRIDLLDKGDVIQVIDVEGHGFEYAVESSRVVRAEGAPLDEIFEQPNAPVITLITCGGEYVPSRREYLDRVIVRAKGA